MSLARQVLAAALGAALVTASWTGSLRAQAEAESPLRVQWGPSTLARAGTALEGYVYNEDRYRVGLIQLRVEVLDEGGNVTNVGRGWVYGDVPSRGRAAFVVRPPSKGASYRITVASFVRISLDAP